MDLLNKFTDNWASHSFATPQQTILLAVSGGSDSMALATLFLKSKLSFAIAHCNFQLRGDESDKDEKLVRDWAFDNNIIFHHQRFDTNKHIDEWKKGVQETARILRYEWFEQLRTENNYAYIATAHNANDNVETLLMNLFKGTGISGLHGIPVKNDKLIRPLLFAEKKDILNYTEAHQVPFREDASNATDNYLRNAIRHHIIPAAEQWFTDVVTHVNGSIGRFAEAEILYNKAIATERKKLLEKRGNDYYLPIRKLKDANALQTICFELFKPFGFSSSQGPHIIDLLSSESGKYISSASHKIIRNRDFLIVTQSLESNTDFLVIDTVPCAVTTAYSKYSFKEEKRATEISSDSNLAFVDADKLKFPLILRKWRIGDYFYPLGMGMKKKKLSKFFIDQKVALHEKEQIWLLESDKHVVWVSGMRLDERFKITGKTTRVLKIEIKPI